MPNLKTKFSLASLRNKNEDETTTNTSITQNNQRWEALRVETARKPPLRGKFSFASLRKKNEDDPSTKTTSMQNQERQETPRTSEDTYEEALEDQVENIKEEHFDETQECIQRNWMEIQPFTRSESPYLVGRHGLYEFSERDDLPPPLPPATPGIEYGITKPVTLPDEPFMQPGEVCSIYDILRESPPEPAKPPTAKEKLLWKTKQAKVVLKNPNVDPEFAMLPDGVNNRIDFDKDALPSKVRRALGTTPKMPKEKELPPIFPPVKKKIPPPPVPLIPLAVPAQPSSIFDNAAPPRYCPKILPTNKSNEVIERDEWGNPYGGYYAIFNESAAARAKRITRADIGRAHRKASDRYLGLQGQRQFSSALIGRPPPLSQRALSEPMRLTEDGVKLLHERMLADKAANEEAITRVHFAPQPEIITVNYAFTDGALGMDQNDGPGSARSIPRDGQSLRTTERLTSTSSGPSGNQPFSTTEQSKSMDSKKSNAADLSTDHSLNQFEQSKLTPEATYATNQPLPPKGSRYFQWDQAMLANRSPVVISPNIPAPDVPPPPVPTAPAVPSPCPDQAQMNLPEIDRDNPLNISGFQPQLRPARRLIPDWKKGTGSKQPSPKPKEPSDSSSNYAESLPPEDEPCKVEVQHTLTKNSERFAQLYQNEVDQAHAELSELPPHQQYQPAVPSQMSAGGTSPFDEADDERRQAWTNTADSLYGQKTKNSEKLDMRDMEKLEAEYPHLLTLRLEKERLEKERLEKERLEKERLERERVEKERVENEEMENESGNEVEDESDIPWRVGVSDETMGETLMSNEYYPWREESQQTSYRPSQLHAFQVPLGPQTAHSSRIPSPRSRNGLHSSPRSYTPSRNRIPSDQTRHGFQHSPPAQIGSRSRAASNGGRYVIPHSPRPPTAIRSRTAAGHSRDEFQPQPQNAIRSRAALEQHPFHEIPQGRSRTRYLDDLSPYASRRHVQLQTANHSRIPRPLKVPSRQNRYEFVDENEEECGQPPPIASRILERSSRRRQPTNCITHESTPASRLGQQGTCAQNALARPSVWRQQDGYTQQAITRASSLDQQVGYLRQEPVRSPALMHQGDRQVGSEYRQQEPNRASRWGPQVGYLQQAPARPPRSRQHGEGQTQSLRHRNLTPATARQATQPFIARPFQPSRPDTPLAFNGAYNPSPYRQPRILSPAPPSDPPRRPLPPLPVSAPLSAPAPPPIPVEPPRPELKKQKSWKSFLGFNLAVSGDRPAKMDQTLQVRPAEYSSVKSKAVEDARQMQATVIEMASKAGKDPPKYALLELIGKGTFGRVYKGKDMTSAAIVAVKIIDIDESDTLNPRLADAYSDFLKEVNALKILSESNARNINHVVEALPVGKAMWMITEYCAGGSVATLMKPTAPGGLQEKWIIPILREVAEAIKWVHQAGIIHRDIKCANVLITEEGGVQLCDFGVAGMIENKLDKRSTVIGTPHWMAPELFSATPSYGKEVDIWAFGSMVFEIATGLPPNVANGIPFERLGSALRQQVPRLEGGNYSNELRDLVAYCLEELPSTRPTIEQVQKHPYINNTSGRYPTSSLSYLVRAFKMWEDHGGSRKSLFMLGGAQGPSESSPPMADDEWNFSTTAAFDQEVSRQSTPQDVFEAYGQGVALEGFFAEETSRPPQKASRRRPPPEALARLPAPLEKIFDPNTLSNYEDNSRSHYGRPMPPPTSDLPLRDDTAQTSIRDTMIDLGGHDSDTGLSNFPDMDTIKANRRGGREEAEDEYASTLHDFSRPALSDPADINTNRRTQDWKFPTMAPPASADPELSRFPTSYDLPRPTVTPGSGGRPALVHHPTEPIGAAFGGNFISTQSATLDRLSMRESLIDLDMSMPDPIPTYTRPSTANSDTGSATSEQMMSGNPFELERHASLYAPLSSESTEITEPEYYITEESAIPGRLRSNSAIRDLGEISDFSVSDAESTQDTAIDGKYEIVYSDSDMPPPLLPAQAPFPRLANQPYTFSHFPDLPAPPSQKALSGLASHDEMKDEFNRMLSSMTSQLEAFRDVYSSPQVVQRKGPMPQRRDRKDGAGGVVAGASNSG